MAIYTVLILNPIKSQCTHSTVNRATKAISNNYPIPFSESFIILPYVTIGLIFTQIYYQYEL